MIIQFIVQCITEPFKCWRTVSQI